jgi:hypothetical protein
MNRHVEMMHGADRELKLTLTPHGDSVMNSRDKNDAERGTTRCPAHAYQYPVSLFYRYYTECLSWYAVHARTRSCSLAC